MRSEESLFWNTVIAKGFIYILCTKAMVLGTLQ